MTYHHPEDMPYQMFARQAAGGFRRYEGYYNTSQTAPTHYETILKKLLQYSQPADTSIRVLDAAKRGPQSEQAYERWRDKSRKSLSYAQKLSEAAQALSVVNAMRGEMQTISVAVLSAKNKADRTTARREFPSCVAAYEETLADLTGQVKELLKMVPPGLKKKMTLPTLKEKVVK